MRHYTKIAFRKESFINAKKVLNFIQSLTNEKKVIKSLTAFHRFFLECALFVVGCIIIMASYEKTRTKDLVTAKGT